MSDKLVDLNALKQMAQRSKTYTDDSIVKAKEDMVENIDDLIQGKQDVADNHLNTENKTIVGAINELKDELIATKGSTYDFNIDLIDSYESFGTGYGFTYYKIAEADAIPSDIEELPATLYTLKLYDSNAGGIIEVPAMLEIQKDHFGRTQYFISSEDYTYSTVYTLLFETWIPNAGIEFSPGVWVKHQVRQDDSSIVYPISVTIGEKTILEEVNSLLDSKLDKTAVEEILMYVYQYASVSRSELYSMIEEELDVSLEE